MLFPFVTDVLREVAELTPGPYLHIGGDEALATPDDQYVEFIEDVQEIVRGLGKTLMGWDDIAAAALEAPFVAQLWIAPSRALAARKWR